MYVSMYVYTRVYVIIPRFRYGLRTHEKLLDWTHGKCACMHTYIHSYIHTYIHTYIGYHFGELYRNLHIHTYIYITHIHNVHTYIHITYI